MSFNLNLYQTKADPRQVTKELSTVAENIQIQPTSTLDVVNPRIIIGYSESYLNANYCYCTLLNRYYYITSTSLEIGKRIVLDCSIDVLYTYSSQIRTCTACVVRQEGIGKPTYITDTQLPIISGKYHITAQLFPDSPVGSSRDFVLTTLGG